MLLFLVACSTPFDPPKGAGPALLGDSGQSADGGGEDASVGPGGDSGGREGSDEGGSSEDSEAGRDSGPDCPEGHAEVGGACLPSCAPAGGDTCAASGSSACDGLSTLDSWDCALCCDRSVYPSPAPHSFHIIDRDDVYAWDSVREMVESEPGPLICSQNRPEDLDAGLWAQKVNATWYASGAELAAALHAALVVTDPHPTVVMIDELNSGTVDIIAEAAEIMAAEHPQWAGHWGAFLVNGTSVHFAGLQPAVDALLDAHASISVEFYPYQSSYCSAGSTSAARDAWLATFYSGDSDIARFDWLRERREGRGSQSDLSVIFGTIDAYMDGGHAAWFLDRMFYVWVTQTDHADLFNESLGYPGPGAYKWDDPSMSNTSRDLAFVESWQHYVLAGETTSREGAVDCE